MLTTLFALVSLTGLLVLIVPLFLQLILLDSNQNLKLKYQTKEDEKVWALVTGGSSGIGLAITEKLAKQGINVIVAALDDKLMASAKQVLPEKYKSNKVEFRFVAVNLGHSDPEVYMAPLREATKDIPVQLIFNNAGYILVGFFHHTSLAAVMANMHCNTTAALQITHHFSRRLILSKLPGAICFTSSPGGFMASPMASMYSSTKAFLTNFAVSIAPELRREGIDVAVVHPSPTNTGFYAQAGAMSALKFFQKTAVGPCIIADSLFAAIGWHVVVDQGYFSVLSRLMLKVLDNNFMGEMMRLFTASGSGDFENVRKEGLAKMEKELKVE